ncbi:hypothetical protein [Streptacidiphilus albus]|uniref:hypothetical protein n=1 Tax=Streptacidiphilus albus TaxID=105425 RepID=UPI000AC5A544|nr:hypothetical protein [Streptacidiphilus albus]
MSRTVRFASTAAVVMALSSIVLPAAMAATPQAVQGRAAVTQTITPNYTCAEHIECDPK